MSDLYLERLEEVEKVTQEFDPQPAIKQVNLSGPGNGWEIFWQDTDKLFCPFGSSPEWLRGELQALRAGAARLICLYQGKFPFNEDDQMICKETYDILRMSDRGVYYRHPTGTRLLRHADMMQPMLKGIFLVNGLAVWCFEKDEAEGRKVFLQELRRDLSTQLEQANQLVSDLTHSLERLPSAS